MRISKQEMILQEVRDRLTEVAFITELPITKRTDAQTDRLAEIYQENQDKFTERFASLMDVPLAYMEDYESPLTRWESVYQDSVCKPPTITNTTHTLEELESLGNKLADAVKTNGGVLEEIISVQEDYEGVLDQVYATFRVLCGFSKSSKADDLVMAHIPVDVLHKHRQIIKYHAIFAQREKTLKTTKEIVSQLISTNEASPRALHVSDPKTHSPSTGGIASGISSRRNK